MIERGHRHSLQPISALDQPNGDRVVKAKCICGLEQQTTVRDGRVSGVRFRFGGLHFQALDLLRVGVGLGVEECPDCGGEPGLVVCQRCGGLGVTASGGEPLAAPDLRVV